MIEILVGLFLIYLFRFAGGSSNIDDDMDDFLMVDYLTDGELDGNMVDD